MHNKTLTIAYRLTKRLIVCKHFDYDIFIKGLMICNHSKMLINYITHERML